jgi:SAM-dependent methyltransferase
VPAFLSPAAARPTRGLPPAGLAPPPPPWQKRRVEPAEYALMDAAEDAMWWYRALHARALAALSQPGWPDRLPVLDAGCGTGGFLARLRRARPDLKAMGVEYHPPAAARARRKSGYPVAIGSVNALPFGSGRFGAVLSLDVLCHAAVQPAAALAEMARVLAPGGLLVLNLPAYAWLRSVHDDRVHNARRYGAAEARALLAGAGLTGIRTGYWNTLLLPLMVLQRKVVSRGLPANRSDVAPFPPLLDRTLGAVTALEHRLVAAMGALGLPAGGSLLAIGRRPP